MRVLVLSLLVVPSFAIAQNGVGELQKASDRAQGVHDDVETPVHPPFNEDTTYSMTMVERMPEFPGGQEGLMRYLSVNVKYPMEAMEAGVQGVVYVEFVVAKDGSVGDAKIKRSPANSLSTEALRVVEAMPGWAPGMLGGKPVRVQFILPIRFTLKDDPPAKKK